MSKALTVIKKLSKRIRAQFPEKLPQTDAAFVAFAAEVMDLAAVPHNDSFVHAIATQVMHLDTSTDSAPKSIFVKALRGAIARQAAYNTLEDIRAKEKEARETAVSSSTN